MLNSFPAWRNLVRAVVAWFLVALPMSFAGMVPASGKAVPTKRASDAIIVEIDGQRAPYYEPVLLQLGRNIYSNLQRARYAVFSKQLTLLRVAIQEARRDLTLLRLPPEQIALNMQTSIIRNKLHVTSEALDSDLWVPLQIEVDEALVHAPAEKRDKPHGAVQGAKQPTKPGDRERVSGKHNEVVSMVQYSLGLLPLHKVSEDLDSAWAAVHTNKPDWQAALAMLQSAIASIHWYTQVPVKRLMAAYNDVVNAYILILGPQARTDQRQEVLDHLAHAASKLAETANTQPAAEEVRGLIRKGNPQLKELRSLLDDIQSQIQVQQERAQDRYWHWQILRRGEIP
jgi:hypothetical protein